MNIQPLIDAVLENVHFPGTRDMPPSPTNQSEFAIATDEQLDAIDPPTDAPERVWTWRPSRTVLDEAQKLTAGARARAYGDAEANAQRFARIASAVTGLDVKPEHLPMLMIALKLARIAETPGHRDSWVDIAGYAQVADLIGFIDR